MSCVQYRLNSTFRLPAGSEGDMMQLWVVQSLYLLIAYSIKASMSERKINRTICSTDSEEIAEVAKKYPLSRSKPSKYSLIIR